MRPPVRTLAALAAVLGELAVPALLEVRHLIAIVGQHVHVRQQEPAAGVGLGLVLFELGQLSSRLRHQPLRHLELGRDLLKSMPGLPGLIPRSLGWLTAFGTKQESSISGQTQDYDRPLEPFRDFLAYNLK